MLKIPIMNFLPESVEIERKYQQSKRKLKKYLVLTLIIIFSSVISETIIITYNYFTEETFSNTSGEILNKNEYLNKMLDISILAKKEQKNLVHIADLLAEKPKNLKITRIEVNEKEIFVDAFSVDSNLFNVYVEKIRENQDFIQNTKIEKINTLQNSPYKVSTIKAELIDKAGNSQ